MPGLRHLRHAARSGDDGGNMARAFDVIQNGAARMTRQHIGGKQHQLAVRINDLSIFGDNTKTVTIAIEGQTDFCVAAL